MSIFTRSSQTVHFKEGRKLTFQLRHVDAEYWRILQFAFLEGAAFSAEDDRNANRVAVISDSARRRFFGDEPALGRTVELDGNDYRICGVVKPSAAISVDSAALYRPMIRFIR